jgi:hypothetical protein
MAVRLTVAPGALAAVGEVRVTPIAAPLGAVIVVSTVLELKPTDTPDT